MPRYIHILILGCMRAVFALLFFSLTVFSFACKKSKRAPLLSPHSISFKDKIGLDSSLCPHFFKQKRVIVLETTEASLISQINRIVAFENRYYILDKRSKSIYVFGEDGSFFKRIRRIGRGPGEYINLTDFTVDPQNRRLVLLCEIPNSLIYIDLDVNFIGQEFKKELDLYISSDSSSMYFASFLLKPKGKHIRIEDGAKSRLYLDYEDYIFNKDFYGPHPNIISSNNIYFFKVYDNQIYRLTEGGAEPAYLIDMGKRFLDIDFVKGHDIDAILTSVTDNEIYRISDFRESNKYIVFSTYPYRRIAIYDKTLKRGKLISEFYDPETGLCFNDFIAHDGKGEEMMFLFLASTFKSYVLNNEKNKSVEVPNKYRVLANNIDENDNPILMIYTLK
ncbi:MAG: 6-bladed beta-propeller [Draconibacterium sp.]